MKRRAANCAVLSTPDRDQGDYLRARHHRGDQSGGAELRPQSFLKAGDEIIVSAMEHHSNIVPWQMLCEQVGAQAAGDSDQP